MQKDLFLSYTHFTVSPNLGRSPEELLAKNSVEWTVKIGGRPGGKSTEHIFCGLQIEVAERRGEREEIKCLYVRNAQFACSDVAGTANEYLVGSHSPAEINAE